MERYRATKINASPEADFSTAETIEQYRENLCRKYGFSPPVDYYVEGIPMSLPKVGNTFMMHRDNRNGVRVTGLFVTSVIKSVEEFDGFCIFTTRNSIYKLEKANV